MGNECLHEINERKLWSLDMWFAGIGSVWCRVCDFSQVTCLQVMCSVSDKSTFRYLWEVFNCTSRMVFSPGLCHLHVVLGSILLLNTEVCSYNMTDGLWQKEVWIGRDKGRC